MSDAQHANLAGELVYVRTLAEEGRNAPLVSGVFYVIWGAVIGVAALLTYLRAAGIAPLGSFVGEIPFWSAAIGIGWVASFYFRRRRRAKPGAMTIGNRTATSAWLAVGVFMVIFWATVIAFHNNFSEYGVRPYILFSLMFPVSFGVYGIAFFVTATAARLDWMRGFAIAAWIFSVASFYYFGDAKQFLVGALGSFLCALLPGVILMRREPNGVV